MYMYKGNLISTYVGWLPAIDLSDIYYGILLARCDRIQLPSIVVMYRSTFCTMYRPERSLRSLCLTFEVQCKRYGTVDLRRTRPLACNVARYSSIYLQYAVVVQSIYIHTRCSITSAFLVLAIGIIFPFLHQPPSPSLILSAFFFFFFFFTTLLLLFSP